MSVTFTEQVSIVLEGEDGSVTVAANGGLTIKHGAGSRLIVPPDEVGDFLELMKALLLHKEGR